MALMREMARRRILVEICLSSNDAVLGVRGPRHPLRQYQRHGVPVALATDDAGVLRSSITGEYLKGIREQQLNYRELKTMARASLEHAFLTGPQLVAGSEPGQPTATCGSDGVGRLLLSDPCRQFLADSPKARLQWELEEALAAFEADLARDDARLIPAAANAEPAWAIRGRGLCGGERNIQRPRPRSPLAAGGTHSLGLGADGSGVPSVLDPYQLQLAVGARGPRRHDGPIEVANERFKDVACEQPIANVPGVIEGAVDGPLVGLLQLLARVQGREKDPVSHVDGPWWVVR